LKKKKGGAYGVFCHGFFCAPTPFFFRSFLIFSPPPRNYKKVARGGGSLRFFIYFWGPYPLNLKKKKGVGWGGGQKNAGNLPPPHEIKKGAKKNRKR